MLTVIETLRTLETVFSSLLKSEYKTKSYTHKKIITPTLDKEPYLLLKYSCIPFAPAFPASIAKITVAAPVTASPPAKTPSLEV